MGNDVVKAITVPVTAVTSTVAGNANEKVYYNCPQCNRRVWVYRSAIAYHGSKCFQCRGVDL